jgi:hypothetical protein
MRRLAIVLVLLGAPALGCGAHSAAPTQEDIAVEAEALPPGATETMRSFRDEEIGRSVDGGEVRNPARLTRRVALDDAMTPAEIVAFHARHLEPQGWAARPSSENHAAFGRKIDGRLHSVLIEVGTGSKPVEKYGVHYTIGLRQ